jgi:5-methylcytosine-specific restriction endonuclease McrA
MASSSVEAPARSGSGDRFYQLNLAHRSALWGDIGNLLQIEGVLVGGEGAQALLLLPGARAGSLNEVHVLSPEQWTDWLQRSDDPEVLIMPQKAFHRKLRYQISGHVQQKVWKADGLHCLYCRRSMGEVQLTIDHWIPLEMGGANDTSNYLSACRRCNKDKGSMDPREWCELKNLQYGFYVNHLAERKI